MSGNATITSTGLGQISLTGYSSKDAVAGLKNFGVYISGGRVNIANGNSTITGRGNNSSTGALAQVFGYFQAASSIITL